MSRYLLDKCVDAACMNCKRVWGPQFLHDSFTKSWMNREWRAHTTKLLFEREKSMLPQTQDARLPGYKLFSTNAASLDAVNEELGDLRSRMIEVERRFYALNRQQNNLVRSGYTNVARNDAPGDAGNASRQRRVYYACPKDGCRGLVDGTWVCGVCASSVCEKCRAILPPAEAPPNSRMDVDVGAHVCDPDAVKTFELLRRDTRPCPNCHVPVTKTSGCDQMWCTACNSAWSWSSGSLIHGQIHNPYYFEFLSRQGRDGRIDDYGNDVPQGRPDDDGDEPVCGDDLRAMRLPPDGVIQVALSRMRSELGLYDTSEGELLRALIQRIRHLLWDTIPAHRTKVEHASRDRYVERLRFLTNDLGQEEFEDILYCDEKKRLKSSEYIQIVETFLMTTSPAVSSALVAIARPGCTEIEARRVMGEALAVYEGTSDFCDSAVTKMNRQWSSTLDAVSVSLHVLRHVHRFLGE